MTLYGYLESVWIGMATFATDFNNSNVITEGRPLTELHLTGIHTAVRSYKAFKQAFLNAQASNGAVTHVPLHLRFATAVPEATPTSNPVRNRNGASSTSRTSNTPTASSTSNGRTRGNNNSTTSNTADNSGASAGNRNDDNQGRPSAKKAKRTGSRFDTANPDRGMFFLRNPSMCMNIVFPPDIPKICPYFTCKGKECNKDPEDCDHHPVRATDLSLDVIAKIGKHFIDNNVGWFNEFHFSKVDLSPELKALLGNKKGMRPAAQGGNQSM